MSSYVPSTRVVVRVVKRERMYFLAAAEVCTINQFKFQGLDSVDWKAVFWSIECSLHVGQLDHPIDELTTSDDNSRHPHAIVLFIRHI